MSYYPVFVDLNGKKAVVIGGGIVAQRKINALLECGASVNIISRDLTEELKRYVDEERVMLIGEEFSYKNLEGAFLVIAATGDSELNSRVGKTAKSMGILVNVVDQPSDCNFIVPSVIRRGDLLIAVSTSGKSPAMAKRIREKLSSQYGEEYGDFLLLMGKLREEILKRGLPQAENSRMFHELVDSTIFDAIQRKDFNEVALNMERILGKSVSEDDIHNYLKAE